MKRKAGMRKMVFLCTMLLWSLLTQAFNSPHNIPGFQVLDHYSAALYPYDENYFLQSTAGITPITPQPALNNHQSSQNITQLAAEPYIIYINNKAGQLQQSISAIHLESYSKWGFFLLIFLMWLGQSITLIKED